MLAAIKSFLPEKAKVVLRKIRKRMMSYGPSLNRGFLSYHYLRGNGIEIGALHNPLEVWPHAKVSYLDRYDNERLKQHYPDQLSCKFVTVDIVDNGELLTTILNDSQDFVIANHFVEHCQNPLLTLKHMHRVLKNEGILYLALPDKRFTFDAKRPITSLEHILNDFHKGPTASKQQHYEEWVSLVHDVKDAQQAKQDVENLIAQDYSIHFHVWTQSEIIEMVLALKKQLAISFDIEVCLKHGVEFILILKKVP